LAPKDRPILFNALATADVLLTLIAIMTPGTNLADHPCLEREDILAAIAYAAQQTNHVVVEVA